MGYWQDDLNVLAGRDIEAGGTWLGVNRSGKFAAITNYRQPGSQRKNALSRGELVSRFLSPQLFHESNSDFEKFLELNHQNYNPFNLVYGDIHCLQLWGYGFNSAKQLKSGFHSISNGSIDQSWPKMSLGVEKLSNYISHSSSIEPEQLLAIMQDTTQSDLDQLPETGIDPGLERELSSIFVRGESYGTRTTTLLLISFPEMEIMEYNYLINGTISQAQQFSIQQKSS